MPGPAIAGARGGLRHRPGNAVTGCARVPGDRCRTRGRPGGAGPPAPRGLRATSMSNHRRSRTGTTAAGASTSWWPRHPGTGSIRRPGLAQGPRCAQPGRLDGPAGQRHHPQTRRAGGVRGDRRPPRALRAGQSQLGHPPLEDEVRAGSEGWGPAIADPGRPIRPYDRSLVPHCPVVRRGGFRGSAPHVFSFYRKLWRRRPRSPCWTRSLSANPHAAGTTTCRAAT